MLKTTPFNSFHRALGGKMVEFGGWDMPVQYSTITLEHQAVRNAVGIFDISHMGQVFVWGSDALPYLQNLVTNNVEKAEMGKGIYAHFLNPNGGVIDDVFIYHTDEDQYLVIINASRADVDIAWMKENKKEFDVHIDEAPFASALAIQGPKAVNLMERFSSQIPSLGHHAIAEISLGEVTALVARTGYTGEDGFELFAPAGHLLKLWPELYDVGKEFGVLPCGLGARDTLRTEVAYPLYGHELDEQHTPLEAGLSWVVNFEKGPFIGRDALLKQKAEGLKVKLAGFKVETGGVARPGGKILSNGKEIGVVASGTFSPTLGYAIGLAYLPLELAKVDLPITILQGTREIEASVVKSPFYKKSVAAVK